FFFSSRRRHTIFSRDWSSDVCSSDLAKKRLTRPLIRVTLDIDLGRPKSLPTRSEGFGMSHRTAPGTRRSRHDGLFYKSLLFAFRSEERRVGEALGCECP